MPPSNKYNTNCALKIEKSERLINSIAFTVTVFHHFNYIRQTSTYIVQNKEEKNKIKDMNTQIYFPSKL